MLQNAFLDSITREIIEKNQSGTGGAQYLLKNIDASFWEDCYNSCIELKKVFNELTTYFENGNKSYQGFCSDMWAVLYTLWRRGHITQTPEDFDFTWGTDNIDKISTNYIYHNAGITGRIMKMGDTQEVMFFKGSYANNNITPFQDKRYLQVISPRFANKVYADTILEIDNPVSLA